MEPLRLFARKWPWMFAGCHFAIFGLLVFAFTGTGSLGSQWGLFGPVISSFIAGSFFGFVILKFKTTLLNSIFLGILIALLAVYVYILGFKFGDVLEEPSRLYMFFGSWISEAFLLWFTALLMAPIIGVLIIAGGGIAGGTLYLFRSKHEI